MSLRFSDGCKTHRKWSTVSSVATVLTVLIVEWVSEAVSDLGLFSRVLQALINPASIK